MKFQDNVYIQKCLITATNLSSNNGKLSAILRWEAFWLKSNKAHANGLCYEINNEFILRDDCLNFLIVMQFCLN